MEKSGPIMRFKIRPFVCRIMLLIRMDSMGWIYAYTHPMKVHKSLRVLGLLLRPKDGIDGSAADRAVTPQSGLPVLHRHPLRVPHLGLLLALNTIVQIGHSRCVSFFHTRKNLHPCIRMYCTRQEHFVSFALQLLLDQPGISLFSKRCKERRSTPGKPHQGSACL